MDTRIANYPRVIPELFQGLLALSMRLKETSLGKGLIALVDLRVSQINGCAYCVDMHVKEARRDGLGEQWINLVSVWRESPVYDARERAVLGWTEALTNLAGTGAPDSDFHALREFFTDAEITRLSVAISTTNVWNRLAVGFRSQHPVDSSAIAA